MTLTIELVASSGTPASVRREIEVLCREAYAEDLAAVLEQLRPAMHVLGRLDGALVSHAMWVTRWLEPAGTRALRTAYVEAVATRPEHQGCGYASAVLRRLATEVADFELAALCPSDARFYARLGWERWQGPLSIRTDRGLEPTPDEEIMILRLPRTPEDLTLRASLSAEWRPGELW